MSQLRGKCPGCPNEFVYEEGTTSVYCEFCQEWKPVATLKPIGGSAKADKAHTGAVPAAAMQGFDNPESGIVFMENFFDTMDWTDYKESPKLEMADLQECLENNKIKNGAIGATWYMEYKGLAVPLSKKLEGLKEKEQEMADEYDPVDSTKAFAAFNIYRKVSDAIIAKRENLITRMEKAIEYATKYNLDAAHVAEITAEFATVKAGLEAVTEVKSITEIPSFVKAKAAIDEAKAAELAEKGINAVDEYENGVAQFNSTNPNKAPALAKLEKVRGYSDSEEYIAKINSYYSLDELRYFFGKYFVYKLEAVNSTFNVGKAGCFGKNKKQPENPEEEVKAWSLYEVVNGVPEDKPVLKGIDSLVMDKAGNVACYNNKIFYIKNGQGLYSYDVYTGEEKMLDKGKDGDYCRNKEGYLEFSFSENKRCFVLKRKLRDDAKTGCTGKRKAKKTEEEIRLNNYSLLLIDMFANSVKTIADEMVDIIGKFGNKVFYSYAHREINTKVKGKGCSKTKEKEVKYLKDLMLVDLAGGAPKQVLSQACEIKYVQGDKVIYWKWNPNKLNKNLSVYNLATGEDILIEDNVYSLDKEFIVIKDRIYYKVGNKNYCTLISNNLEGTDRKEVMQEVSNVNIILERAGWLYVLVGGGKNRLLVKIHSEDTETRYPVCPQFYKVIDITSTHIYYQDTSYNLRVVCADGTDNKILAANVRDFVDGDDCLYYVRVETIEEAAAGLFGATTEKEGVSLYKMDKEGHNIRKLVFGVDRALDYDRKALYYTKAEELRFKVTMPTIDKETGEKDWHYEYHSVQRYFRFEKATEKSTLVLTTGLPSAKMKSDKKGCFGKKEIEEDIIYEADPEIVEYEPQGLAPMGETDIDYEINASAEEPQGIQALTKNLPAGCSGKKKDAAPADTPAKKNNGCGCTGKKK